MAVDPVSGVGWIFNHEWNEFSRMEDGVLGCGFDDEWDCLG